MTGWRAWWDSLTPDSKNFISNTASGVAVIFIGGILYLCRKSIMALGRRVFAPETPTPALTPTPTPIVIEVKTAQEPPTIESPAPATVVAPALAPHIPRPPAVGFVARRDTDAKSLRV